MVGEKRNCETEKKPLPTITGKRRARADEKPIHSGHLGSLLEIHVLEENVGKGEVVGKAGKGRGPRETVFLVRGTRFPQAKSGEQKSKTENQAAYIKSRLDEGGNLPRHQPHK